MNEIRNRLIKEGWQYTGATFKEYEREKAQIRLTEFQRQCKQFKSKARIVRVTEVSHFRDGTSKYTYLRIYVLYSEEHKEHNKRMAEEQKARNQQAHLRYLVDHGSPMNSPLSLEDIQFMLSHKIDQIRGEQNEHS